LAADLQRTRDAAQQHQAEAVGALETIRLELLRMHAGAGSVESLTADLGAAQALSEDIERLLAGKREVEELLGGR
jgi:serine/threonine-protein kinase